MYAPERQQRILEIATASGRVEVTALARDLEVTPETIRRDLTQLERLGRLRRVHGGAIPVERFGFEPTVQHRSERLVAEKMRIAKAALDLLPDDGTILLDAGTTTACLADLLPLGRELTVVTNSLAIASTLADRSDLTLSVLGGRIRGRTQASVGEWATSPLAGIHVDVAFLGTNGLSVAHGLTTPDQDEAAAKRAMVAAARRAVVLADSTKVGLDHFCRFAALAEMDTFVTDTSLDDETVAEIEAAGPEVICA